MRTCFPLVGLGLLVTTLLLRAAPGDGVKVGGPGEPLTPAAEQQTFRLPAGLRMELVAAEPQVESPVALAFDLKGRLWVVEMRDYPNGPGPGQPPQGRVRILEDRDGDGTFEHASTFADNLLFANGLLLWKDGVIVTAAPHIVHLRDTDGDGTADRRDVLFEGFATQNPQLRVSHPVLGLDGWVYVANGLRGGMVKRAGKDGPPLNLGGLDFRFDPRNPDRFEAVSGMGQFGNTVDVWGNRFVCDNRHHLRHVVLEDRYVKRNPFLAVPALVEDVSVLDDGPLNSGGKIYPLSRNWTTSNLHEGRFTAACGVFVFDGKRLGKGYRGAAFTCDPTGNLVHMETLRPKGATFQATPYRRGVEFLASPDDWFRPVFLTSGPDGALYVADMYRAVIEHPEFMPPELKNRPDLWRGKDKGRIWRIVSEKHARKPRPTGLTAAAGVPELVAALEQPEPWTRATARRLLLERPDRAAVEPLRKLFDDSPSPIARLTAAHLLERFDGLDEERVDRLLAGDHPRLREHGIRLAEPRITSEKLRARLLGMADDADARVRNQLALTLGAVQDAAAVPALAAIARAGADDRWTRYAVESAVAGRAGDLLAALTKTPGEPRAAERELYQELGALIGARQDKREMALAMSVAEQAGAPERSLAVLNGLADGVARRGGTLLTALAGLSPTVPYPARFEDFLRTTVARRLTPDAPADQRRLGVRLFAHGPWDLAKKTLLPLLDNDPDPAVRLAAVRALAAHADKEAPGLLMDLWRGATPAVRREILEAMFRTPGRVRVLLGEVEEKRVRPAELDAGRARQMLAHPDAAIRDRARRLFQDAAPAERQAVLKQYQAALELKGDPKRGREVFKQNCATCHRVAGVGVDVGPDIADTRTKTSAALLGDILLPNQAIDNNYLNYLVTGKDGKVYSGLLAAETGSSVTLRRAEGQTDTVLRQDIEEIASTGVSLMPEGLEKNIPPQAMADLLGFLKNWRYLDGTVPLGQ